MRTYALDTEAAKQANSSGKRITEAGAYTGEFRHAWHEVNDNRTEGVFFLFVSSDGREAGPLALYTHNSEGKALPGFNMLNAIMVCSRVKELTTRPVKIELWDYDVQKNVAKEKNVFTALTSKPIGLLLRLEDYEGRRGEVRQRLVIHGAFEPHSRLMAGEILERATEPKALDTAVDWLLKNPVKPLKSARKAAAVQHGTGAAQFDDDIPY